MNLNPIGAVAVTVYSRADLFETCLDAIIKANDKWNIPLVVLHQLGHPQMQELITRRRDEIDYLIQLNGDHLSALQNINRNRIICNNFAFTILKSEWILGIEEDVEISADAISFVHQVYENEKKHKNFRGINLGSIEIPDEAIRGSYSKLRYGLNGQAGVYLKKTWKSFDQNFLLNQIGADGLDGIIEPYLKTGYMATSNANRMIDRGWSGTHADPNQFSPYYRTLSSNFIGNSIFPQTEYLNINISHNWRVDCVPYRRIDDAKFWFVFILSKYLSKRTFMAIRVLYSRRKLLRIKPRI